MPSFAKFIKALLCRADGPADRQWHAKWSDPSFNPPWLNRGISPEIVEAVESGWFQVASPMLDIGCGEGVVAAWMAEHGYPAVGVDIAQAAIDRARVRFGSNKLELEFLRCDVSAMEPPDRQYGVLVDRGCLHCIEREQHARYRRTLDAVSAPNARMILFHRAYRDGIEFGDRNDRRRVDDAVQAALGASFTVCRAQDTFLDAQGGTVAADALPGIAYWLEKR